MSKTLVAVTGASSGIGEAFVRKLAPEHDVLLIARRADRLQQLARELSERYDSQLEVLPADLTQEKDVASVADRLATDNRLALLVNNAGFGTRGRFWEAPFASQEDMHKVHVMAPLRLTHAALRNMVPRDFGAVINVASISAFVRQPGGTSYAATKTWLTTFSEGLYVELRNMGSSVTVQALCPGYTYSEFHDKLDAERKRLAPESMWHSADYVVEASLAGLRKRKLFVVPGWRYRLLTALLTKMPTTLRLGIEANLSGRTQASGASLPPGKRPQIPSDAE